MPVRIALLSVSLCFLMGCDISDANQEKRPQDHGPVSIIQPDTAAADSVGREDSAADFVQRDDDPGSNGSDEEAPCPDAFPDHLPLDLGKTFNYAYTMTKGGGLASGEDRGYGKITWRVENPLKCNGEWLLASISTESTIITEYRALAGDDQRWKRRDSTHTTGTLRISFSAGQGLFGVMGEPIPSQALRAAPDTLKVFDGTGAYQESARRTFVRNVGLIRHEHFERFGLGGGSRSVTIELIEDDD